MYILNDKIKDLVPYEPIEAEGKIRLDANESFLNPSSELSDKILKAVGKVAFNRYPDPKARELCKAFAKLYNVNPDFVTAGNGSDELISIINSAFLQKGDAVMTMVPDFSMYAFYAYVSEGNLIELPKNEDFTIDVDRAINEINEKNVKLVLFSNPCNPTSIVLEKEKVRKLITSVNALVVLDEAYMDFSDQSLIEEIENFDNVIILKTCSKALGMAAIRLGFAISSREITKALQAVKSPYNVNSVTQEIGREILSDIDSIKSGIKKIIASRDDLYEGLKKIENKYPDKIKLIKPDTNFVYMKAEDAQEIFKYLFDNGIVIRCFKDYLRIAAGRNYENAAVLDTLEKYFAECDKK